MNIEINRYPTSGGTVSYEFETSSDTRLIRFTVNINAGHRLTKVYWTNGATYYEKEFGLTGPSTISFSYKYRGDKDHYFSAYFDGAGQDTYDLTVATRVSPLGCGTAYASPSSFTSVPIGQVSTFKLYAIAKDGYVFDHWERSGGTATSTSNPWSRTASPDSAGSSTRTYVAYFRTAKTRTITATVYPEGGGLVNGVETYTANFVEGSTSSVSLTAEPATGYVFDRWERESPTGKSVYTRSFVVEATTNERWVAYFTNNPSYISTLRLRIHPAKSDHGRHGQVSVKLRDGYETTVDDDTDIKFQMANNEPSVSVDVVVLSDLGMTFEKLRSSYDGTVYGIEEGVEKSVRVGYNGRIDVFFGCGKLLYKDNGLACESNGKLIYCG